MERDAAAFHSSQLTIRTTLCFQKPRRKYLSRSAKRSATRNPSMMWSDVRKKF